MTKIFNDFESKENNNQLAFFKPIPNTTAVLCAQSLQSCPTLCDAMDCSPPDSVHGILQARIPGRVAMPSSRASSRPRD